MPSIEVGRLALREEGNLWVAYYAPPDTMQGAIFLGSICVSFAEDPEHKRVFVGLMRECVGDIIEDIVGVRPVWHEPEGHPAPEHERGGNA
jgi:hypothetical protein